MPNSFPILVNAGGSCMGDVGLTPQTGQGTSYGTGDDADYKAGSGADFFTLNYNNPFGNTNRFTDTLGGSTYTNGIMLDWAQWDRISANGKVVGVLIADNGANINWDDARAWCIAQSVGEFTTNWRMLNRNEGCVLMYNDATNYPLNYAPLNKNAAQNFWLGTSQAAANALVIGFQKTIPIAAKTSSIPYRALAGRTFIVNGTTLT